MRIKFLRLFQTFFGQYKKGFGTKNSKYSSWKNIKIRITLDSVAYNKFVKIMYFRPLCRTLIPKSFESYNQSCIMSSPPRGGTH